MSFMQYCEKCDMETRHINKEKTGKDEDVCISCIHKKELKKEKNDKKTRKLRILYRL